MTMITTMTKISVIVTIVTTIIWLKRTITVIILCKRTLLDETITMIVTKIKTFVILLKRSESF